MANVVLRDQIPASELIKLLQERCKDGDLLVEFYSNEWTDNLEEMAYRKRYFEKVRKHNGVIRIYIGMW